MRDRLSTDLVSIWCVACDRWTLDHFCRLRWTPYCTQDRTSYCIDRVNRSELISFRVGICRTLAFLWSVTVNISYCLGHCLWCPCDFFCPMLNMYDYQLIRRIICIKNQWKLVLTYDNITLFL